MTDEPCGLHVWDCAIWLTDDMDCDCGGLPDPNDTVDPDAAHDVRVSRQLTDDERGAA